MNGFEIAGLCIFPTTMAGRIFTGAKMTVIDAFARFRLRFALADFFACVAYALASLRTRTITFIFAAFAWLLARLFRAATVASVNKIVQLTVCMGKATVNFMYVILVRIHQFIGVRRIHLAIIRVRVRSTLFCQVRHIL